MLSSWLSDERYPSHVVERGDRRPRRSGRTPHPRPLRLARPVDVLHPDHERHLLRPKAGRRHPLFQSSFVVCSRMTTRTESRHRCLPTARAGDRFPSASRAPHRRLVHLPRAARCAPSVPHRASQFLGLPPSSTDTDANGCDPDVVPAVALHPAHPLRADAGQDRPPRELLLPQDHRRHRLRLLRLPLHLLPAHPGLLDLPVRPAPATSALARPDDSVGADSTKFPIKTLQRLNAAKPPPPTQPPAARPANALPSAHAIRPNGVVNGAARAEGVR